MQSQMQSCVPAAKKWSQSNKDDQSQDGGESYCNLPTMDWNDGQYKMVTELL